MNRPVAPGVGARMHYVLILEWLEDDDRRTGAELHGYLQAPRIPSELVVCNSALDLQTAIDQAHRDLGIRGIPAVHIESHGTNPDEVAIAEMGFGTHAAPGLSWADLGSWLAPLSAASGFSLVVVGATCFGMGTMGAMSIYSHTAPFAGLVGFTTRVRPGSLMDSMREFYRSLAADGSVTEAVENAKRELRDEAESLGLISASTLALHVLRGAFNLIVERHGAGVAVPVRRIHSLPDITRMATRARMQEAWDAWFPRGLQEMRPEYRLDWSLVE